MAPLAKNSKPIFKTSSPFTETTWPQISDEDQKVILNLVCNLIAPLGDHRRTHIHPSQGKKRKRKSKEYPDDATVAVASPPAPEIGKHLLVGINSITRHLEALAAKNAPSTMPGATQEVERKGTESGLEETEPSNDKAKDDSRHLSIVLLTHPKPFLSPAHAHFPTLIHLSTLQPPSSATTAPTQSSPARLIPLPTSSDSRLASALQIPRVGALAMFANAPGAQALEKFVLEKVGVTECMWVDEAMKAVWRGVNVKTETAIGKTKKTGKVDRVRKVKEGKVNLNVTTKNEKNVKT